MKKLLLLIAVSAFVLGCNNSGSSSTAKDTTTNNPTNVENVNGNVPDTNSGMNLDHPLPVDSSRIIDSAKKASGNH